jgi:hypothetical protein
MVGEPIHSRRLLPDGRYQDVLTAAIDIEALYQEAVERVFDLNGCSLEEWAAHVDALLEEMR